MHHQKKKSDHEYIVEFCKVLGLEETKTSMTKFKCNKDWKCIMTKEYKLIEFDQAMSIQFLTCVDKIAASSYNESVTIL